MEYIVLVLMSVASLLMAYFIVKLRINLFLKWGINFASLLCFGFLTVVSGLKETALMIYIILLVLTLFGILMRVISPLFLNLIGSFVARITKQDYEWQKYDQLMEAEQSGNKMYFCIITFTTLKVMLYILLVVSSVGLF